MRTKDFAWWLKVCKALWIPMESRYFNKSDKSEEKTFMKIFLKYSNDVKKWKNLQKTIVVQSHHQTTYLTVAWQTHQRRMKSQRPAVCVAKCTILSGCESQKSAEMIILTHKSIQTFIFYLEIHYILFLMYF